MKALVFNKKNIPGSFDFDQYLKRLNILGVEFDKLDADSKKVGHLLDLYDIVDFPAILITKDDGSMIELWQKDLPSPENVSHFYHQ